MGRRAGDYSRYEAENNSCPLPGRQSSPLSLRLSSIDPYVPPMTLSDHTRRCRLHPAAPLSVICEQGLSGTPSAELNAREHRETSKPAHPDPSSSPPHHYHHCALVPASRHHPLGARPVPARAAAPEAAGSTCELTHSGRSRDVGTNWGDLPQHHPVLARRGLPAAYRHRGPTHGLPN